MCNTPQTHLCVFSSVKAGHYAFLHKLFLQPYECSKARQTTWVDRQKYGLGTVEESCQFKFQKKKLVAILGRKMLSLAAGFLYTDWRVFFTLTLPHACATQHNCRPAYTHAHTITQDQLRSHRITQDPLHLRVSQDHYDRLRYLLKTTQDRLGSQPDSNILASKLYVDQLLSVDK